MENEIAKLDLSVKSNIGVANIYPLVVDLLQGRFSKAYKESSEFLDTNLDVSLITKFYFHVIRSWALLRTSTPNIIKKELDITEGIYLKIDSSVESKSLKTWYTGLLLLKGENEWFQGNSDSALELFHQGLQNALDNNSDFGEAQAYYLLGHVSGYIGDLKKAIEYQQKNLKILRKFDNPLLMAISLNDLGLNLVTSGMVSEALEVFNESLKLGEKLPNKYHQAVSLIEIGVIQLSTGEHDKALNNLKLVEKLANVNNLKRPLCSALQEIGLYHRDLGRSNEAIEYLLKAYEISKSLADKYARVTDKIRLSHIVFQLILSYQQRSELEKSKRFLKDLINLDNELDNKFVRFRRQLAEALMLKISPRMSDFVKAQKILGDIINEYLDISSNLMALAMINLVELLLQEFRVMKEAEVFREIEELLEKLTFIAEKQDSAKLLSEIYILRARFGVISNDLEKVDMYLKHALMAIEEKQFPDLKRKIEKEKNDLEEEISKWNMLEKDTPVLELLKFEYFENYLSEIKKMMERRK